MARGWGEVGVGFAPGGAYVDHPSFAVATLGRVRAMKMEASVRTPIVGTVRELCADVAAAVKAQHLSVLLDAKK